MTLANGGLPQQGLPDPAMDGKRDNQMFASSLATGLGVLLAFSADEPGLTNAALARRTGLSRATISRVTFTLCEMGLLYYDSTDRQYRIGPGAVSLGYPFMLHLRIQHVALPMMQAFADRHRTTVSLGMRSGLHMIYIDSCRSFEGSEFRADAGASLSMLRTAMGRAWLAAQAPAERRRVCDELRQSLPSDWRKYAPALRESITSISTQGYCVNTGDLHADLQAVAAPLAVSVAGRTVVLNTGLPTELVRAGVLDRLGKALAKLAQKVEAAWRDHE